MKCSLGISHFLEEISSLSHSIVFFYFFALITEEAFLISRAILWNSVFKWVYLSFSPLLFTFLLFTAICKASSDSHFPFLHFFFLGMVLIPVSCTMSWTFIHSFSGTLSDLIPWIYMVVLVVKNLPANVGDARDTDSILGSGRSPDTGDGNPLQHSCLENSTDGGAWWAGKLQSTGSQRVRHDWEQECTHTKKNNE